MDEQKERGPASEKARPPTGDGPTPRPTRGIRLQTGRCPHPRRAAHSAGPRGDLAGSGCLCCELPVRAPASPAAAPAGSPRALVRSLLVRPAKTPPRVACRRWEERSVVVRDQGRCVAHRAHGGEGASSTSDGAAAAEARARGVAAPTEAALRQPPSLRRRRRGAAAAVRQSCAGCGRGWRRLRRACAAFAPALPFAPALAAAEPARLQRLRRRVPMCDGVCAHRGAPPESDITRPKRPWWLRRRLRRCSRDPAPHCFRTPGARRRLLLPSRWRCRPHPKVESTESTNDAPLQRRATERRRGSPSLGRPWKSLPVRPNYSQEQQPAPHSNIRLQRAPQEVNPQTARKALSRKCASPRRA